MTTLVKRTTLIVRSLERSVAFYGGVLGLSKYYDDEIVLSGDTNYSEAVVKLAKGADLLVHEALYVPGVDAMVKRVPNASSLREHLLASHTTTEDVGRVAAEAGVKKLALSHLVPGDDPSITDEMWLEGVRKHYKGDVVVGKDLMVL